MDRIAHGELVVVIDCADLGRAAAFWAAVLGYDAEDAEDDGITYRTLRPRGGQGAEILLQRTADAKVAKNRLHLDLRVRDLDREVARVAGLGATVLTDTPVREYGWTWHVLSDPDGNEFCVLRPPEGYWASRS
ncbi:MAG: VOC family protein [Streptosporangiales bacterium]|nr:VOC family protein [Streptosporangiales bacterium]